METIYLKNPKKYEFAKSISTPLFNTNNIGKRLPLYLDNTTNNKLNPLLIPDKIKIQMMEDHLKKLEQENYEQEEQINALISYQKQKRFDELNNNFNYMNDISLTSKNIYRPFNYYMNELDRNYNLNKEKIKTKKNKSFIEKKKIRIYKENIENLKELLGRERMKKRINKSLYHNLFLNIKKDINNFMNEVNNSFQKKIENDNGLNDSMNMLKNDYNEIKDILNKKIIKLQNNQKKGFDEIRNKMVYKLKDIKEKEKLRNSKIKKEINYKIKNQRNLEKIKRQKELDKFRRKLEIENIENQKLYEELKFEKLKRDLLKQRNDMNKMNKIPRIIQGYQYQNPYNPFFPPNYYDFL